MIYHLAKQMIDESYNLNEIKDSTYYRHLATLKGLQPKVLQKLLGHTDITVTMNTYCDAFEAYTNANLEQANRYMDSILGTEQKEK